MIDRIVGVILGVAFLVGGWLFAMNDIVNDTVPPGLGEKLTYATAILFPIGVAVLLFGIVESRCRRKSDEEWRRQREAEKKRRESLSGEAKQRAREAEKERWRRRREEALK